MVEFPKIPTEITYSGDEDAGRRLTGFGKKRYADLVTFMKPRKLKTHWNFIKLDDGSTVTTTHSHGLSGIHIYVPLKGGVKKQEEEKVEYPLSYYFRIYNDGIAWPQYPADRLIIWEMIFSEDEEEAPGFTPLDGDINHGNGFVPGQGHIVLDVDMLTDTIYVPDGELTDERRAKILIKATEYISRIDASQLPDIADDIFNTGDINDPMRSWELCNNAAEHPATDLYLNEYYNDPSSNHWYHMIENWPAASPEQTAWTVKYCPDEGGSPDVDYLAEIWPNLTNNALHYGQQHFYEYSITAPEWTWDDWMGITEPHPDKDDPTFQPDYTDRFYGLFSQIRNFGGYENIHHGRFFTGIDTVNEYPSFFSFYKRKHSGLSYSVGQINYYTEGGAFLDAGSPPSYKDDFSFNVNVDHGSGKKIPPIANDTLVTPLEEIDVEEIYYKFGSLGCDDTDCYRLGSDLLLIFSICTIANNAPSYFRSDWIYRLTCLPKSKYTGDIITELYADAWDKGSYYEQSVRIPDPAEITINEQKNFVSYMVYVEAGAEVRTAHREIEGNNLGWWMCNGERVQYLGDFDDIDPVYTSAVGVVIYIFAPEYLEIELDPIGEPGVMTYWDIHSARYPNSEISHYRCLALEEYVMPVIDTYKAVSRDNSHWDTLNYYGYEIQHGFVHTV